MVPYNASDTIRILVSTDNHVGYAERDAERGNDSAAAFEEVMRLAKDHDVDMVLLAGDLFHENKPSRKAMHGVMKSLRTHCFGDKPCELQMLSDAGDVFEGVFNHVNYEDENLNVSIPVFSIHGNHDDPSGEGHLSALDILQMGGMLNYYGRVPENDHIQVKPVLLQKGRTKLALYGLSNVRDERLFRTFRDNKVKFFTPQMQKSDWFNLMSVHQNHHAHSDTSYLPENFLPEFLDLVIWGHEHECLIEPRYNPETGFHVMQPGSSIATSLCTGEAVPKHAAILSITGKEFQCQPLRLKSVRPFVMREIALMDSKEMKAVAKKSENRTQVTRYLEGIVKQMIAEAKESWLQLQEDGEEVQGDCPKPLIRLRVEYTAPEGGKFDCENPQRFSNRFGELVANKSDVVQFHRKKAKPVSKGSSKPEQPDEEAIAQLSIDAVKVDKLVKEFLLAQSLTILPQNQFGDAVDSFVLKDDNAALKTFVDDSLDSQVKHLLKNDNMDQEEMSSAMEDWKAKMEARFGDGLDRLNATARNRRTVDSDEDMEHGEHGVANGHGPEQDRSDDDMDIDGSAPPRARARQGKANQTRSMAKTNGNAKKAAPKASTSGRKTAATKSTAKQPSTRGRKAVTPADGDVIELDDDEEEEPEEEESQGLFVSNYKQAPTQASKPKPAPKTSNVTSRQSKAKSQAPSVTQSRLNFSQTARPARATATRRVEESEDEISDDDDAFEPAPSTARSTRARR